MALKEKVRSSSSLSTASLELGKLPPQAMELEEAVLGGIMLEKDALISVIDILKADSFYNEANKKIFQAILALSDAERPIDILTVTEELRKKSLLKEVGGSIYISKLTNRVASAANIEYHARIVAQKHIQRELIRVSSEIQTRAFDESIDVDDLLDFSEQELFQIAEGNIKRETARINVLIKEAILQIEEAGKTEGSLIGVPSGFTKLDRITSGWQKSDLIILAARPSMGKTAFALSMAKNIAVDHGRPIGFFSLEMSSIQLVTRLIVSETELPSHRIRNGKLDDHEWKQLESNIKTLVDAPIFIDDTPAISLFEFRAKARRLKLQFHVEIIVVDYLQLMTSSADNRGSREQEVSSISRSLKAIAKELEIPIIALSQLNRSVETRTGSKRPQLSDLRESGAIEQDADLVLFIHRPEKYGFLTDEDGNSNKGLAEIIVAKHRNGPIDDVTLRFREEMAKFVEPDEMDIAGLDNEKGISSISYGSKMNDDLKGGGNSFENDGLSEDEPF